MGSKFKQEKNNLKPVEFVPKSLSGTWGIVRIPLWHSNVIYFIGDRTYMQKKAHESIGMLCGDSNNEKEWVERCADFVYNWIQNKGTDSSCDGDAFGFEGNCFIRITDFILGNVDDIAVLSHECLHVANAILNEVGLREDVNIEGLCYTHEHIFSSILKQLLESAGE